MIVAVAMAAMLVIGLQASAALAQTWDLADDWPAQVGPPTWGLPLPAINGQWQYGYGANFDVNTLSYTFTLFENSQGGQWGIQNDGVYLPGAAPAPFVGKDLGHPANWPGQDIPIGDVGGHTMIPDFPVPVVFRWTAPSNMWVNVVAKGWIAYTPGYEPSAPTRDFFFNVRKGTAAPFLTGHAEWHYLSLPDLESNHKTAVSGNIYVGAGEYLDYFQYPNTTGGISGFDFTITVIPEPTSLLAMCTGIISLGGLALRRRSR